MCIKIHAAKFAIHHWSVTETFFLACPCQSSSSKTCIFYSTKIPCKVTRCFLRPSSNKNRESGLARETDFPSQKLFHSTKSVEMPMSGIASY